MLLEIRDEFLDFLQSGRDLIGFDPDVVEFQGGARLFAVDCPFTDGVAAVFEFVPEASVGLEVVLEAVGADARQPHIELLEELFVRGMNLGEGEIQADSDELLAFENIAQLGAFRIGVCAHVGKRAKLRPKGDTEEPLTPPPLDRPASPSSRRSGS